MSKPLSWDELHAYALMMGWRTAGDRYSIALGDEPLLRLLTKENKRLFLRTYWSTNFATPDARCRIAAIIWAQIYLEQQEEQHAKTK